MNEDIKLIRMRNREASERLMAYIDSPNANLGRFMAACIRRGNAEWAVDAVLAGTICRGVATEESLRFGQAVNDLCGPPPNGYPDEGDKIAREGAVRVFGCWFEEASARSRVLRAYSHAEAALRFSVDDTSGLGLRTVFVAEAGDDGWLPDRQFIYHRRYGRSVVTEYTASEGV